MKTGKKTKQWNRIRAKVKKDFESKGITRCEKCGSDFGLSFAHRAKRRFIKDEQELSTVALLCIPCHQVIEAKTHEQMFSEITQIIEQREVREI